MPVAARRTSTLRRRPGPRGQARAVPSGPWRATSAWRCATIELRRGGPSYTVDTLEELHARRPEHELTFIAGGDMAPACPSGVSRSGCWSWRDSLSPSARAPSARRSSGARRGLSGRERMRLLRDAAHRRVFLGGARPRVAAGRPIDELVPGAVAAYIDERGLYRAGGDGAMSPLSGEELARLAAEYADDKKARTSSSSTCAAWSATPTTS